MAERHKLVGKPRRARTPRAALPNTPDPIDIAMEAEASGTVPEGVVAVLLGKQARLIDVQMRREHEEFHALRAQRAMRWLIVALIAGTLLSLVVMAVQASRSRALIVEPFEVPAALATRGYDGTVAARHLLGAIERMQAQTQSSRAADSFANNWDDDVKLAIPQTGVSVGELWRLMRQWLGNDTCISGDVTLRGDVVTLSLTRTGSAPIVATGPVETIDAVIDDAAEQLFAATQPYRHIVYLRGKPEALARAKQLAINGPVEERPWGYIAWGNLLRQADPVESTRMLKIAVAKLPGVTMPLINIASNFSRLGDSEMERRYLVAAVEATVRHPERIGETYRHYSLVEAPMNLAMADQDYARYVADAPKLDAVTPPSRRDIPHGNLIFAQLQLHDSSAAGATFARQMQLPGAPPMNDPQLRVIMLAIDMVRTAEFGSASEVSAVIDRTQGENAAFVGSTRGQILTEFFALEQMKPLQARLYVRAGRFAEAEIALRGSLARCYPCAIVLAEVAAARGDAALAERRFARAKALGPSLSPAQVSHGRARMARGENDSAIALFAEASRRSPRWADPLKYTGDVLVAQGKDREAMAKYAAAATRAPRWGALHLDWGIALLRRDDRESARQKLRAASRMDLSSRDRGRLERAWAAANRPT